MGDVQPNLSLYKRYTPRFDQWEELLEYPSWAPTFIEFLERTGNMGLACQAAGVHLITIRKYLRGERTVSHPKSPSALSRVPRGPNPRFCEEVNGALDLALERLSLEAHRRALSGSDQLLIFLLKALDPDLYDPPKILRHQADLDNLRQISDARARLMSRFLEAESASGETPDVIDADSEDVTNAEEDGEAL